MLVFNENNEPDIISNPTSIEYFWVLDLEMGDFTLAPLAFVEEIQSKCIEIDMDGYRFIVPEDWCILIFDPETLRLDVASVSKDVPGHDFSAVVYGPNMPNIEEGHLKVVDMLNYTHVITPYLNKHQMLCHPINDKSWVCIAPSDADKNMKLRFVVDIL